MTQLSRTSLLLFALFSSSFALAEHSKAEPGCGMSGWSIGQRIGRCGHTVRHVPTTGATFTLVARPWDAVGELAAYSEYLRDDSSGFIWSPQAPHYMNWVNAIRYCDEKRDFNLKWHLPSRDEFLHAGNPDNKDFYYNGPFVSAMAADDVFIHIDLWTSTYYAGPGEAPTDIDVTVDTFDPNDGGLSPTAGYVDEKGQEKMVRCVGRR